MRTLFLWLGLIVAAVWGQDEAAVSATDLLWHDAARNRDVPVRIYAPPPGNGPLPVIIFSHGLGGSREGYAYLGKYWAAHGYISVHVQHLGSDNGVAVSLEAMEAAMANLDNFINRPKDISFAIDQVSALNQAPGAWQGRFDLDRIGVAGHSFGAYTTMMITGEKFDPPRDPRLQELADPRVKAVVAMSIPHIPGEQFSGVRIPALHFTGTEDRIRLLPSDSAQERRDAFDQSPGPDTYLVIFQGGDHMVFSGRQRTASGDGIHDALFQSLVCQGSVAFWDAYLKGDARAKQWLADGGFAKALESNATFEKK